MPGKTPRTTVKRLPTRGHYDRATRDAILDEGLVAHVGFAVDGQAYVVPMSYARDGERLLLHGSVASRMMRRLADGAEICVTVTLLDGLVLARSQFHHSMNYRSVMAFGPASAVTDATEKHLALEKLVEHLVPGRAADSREASEQELAATEVIEFRLDEASAKVRTGPPGDAPPDLQLGHWSGVIPLSLSTGTVEPAPDLAEGIEAPEYVTGYRRPGGTKIAGG